MLFVGIIGDSGSVLQTDHIVGGYTVELAQGNEVVNFQFGSPGFDMAVTLLRFVDNGGYLGLCQIPVFTQITQTLSVCYRNQSFLHHTSCYNPTMLKI